MTQHTLGTLLRTLIERLDADVEARYRADGLDYRPRFTPVVRALVDLSAPSIADIARHVGMRHSAISQTVGQMQRTGLVTTTAGSDGRERIVTPTAELTTMIPSLQRHWDATSAAEVSLNADLPASLTAVVRAALSALDEQSFERRAANHFDKGIGQ